jgi:hypothetical protein
MTVNDSQIRVSLEIKNELRKIALEWTFRDHRRWTAGDVVAHLVNNMEVK